MIDRSTIPAIVMKKFILKMWLQMAQILQKSFAKNILKAGRFFLHIRIWSSFLNFVLYIVVIKVEFLNALISFVKVSIFTVYQTVQTKGSRSSSLSFDLKRCRNLLKNKVKAPEIYQWIKVFRKYVSDLILYNMYWI